MTQRRGIHSFGAGFFKRHSAGMQSRASGEHIIDDDITLRRVDGLPVGEDESSGDILPALLPAEPGLRDGLVLFPEKRLGSAPGDEVGEAPGDSFGLIVATVPSAGGV